MTCANCNAFLRLGNPGPLCDPCSITGKTQATVTLLRQVVQRHTWQKEAACQGKPTEWWFPDAGPDGRGRVKVWLHRGVSTISMQSVLSERATAICLTCPVQRECLEDAIATQDEHGIRGGVKAEARRGESAEVLLERVRQEAATVGLVQREESA